ncbi:vacuolar DHA amino acid exporter [Lentinus tigrinus ALCF2SS1-7]|uniref:Vacuolar DHA amino acid exporter n=1 Tax=Lentinus tigrinus ALCF2SS1-6 TaxID=1328759 RepID=A0A5C2RYR0_9APHY|nr:vacuolar DHA amino acid exporter [Lentinus tigrinus ALCF2SS1-6]RPD73958.1 vacuolar DHA amino acid exporter [Lentinus tigrinus ALCF2SS1-7]
MIMSDEKRAAVAVAPSADVTHSVPATDIEHAGVVDDPRAWSNARKLTVVGTVSAASMIAGLGANIYNPALSQIEEQLHASSSSLALSLSLFILIQGGVPLLWSTLSEFWGRKKVYLVSMALCTVGCIVAALAKTISVLIGMRCIQGFGSSAVMSLGAATLSDIYEPEQRGTMMGIYYSAPLLGPSLGPILGGVLTQGFDWRATFWFLAIFVGVCFLLFIPFKDTFRRERSLTYQTALKKRRAQLSAKASEASSISQVTAVSRVIPQAADEKTADATDKDVIEQLARDRDLEKQQSPRATAETDAAPMDDVKLSLADVNPAKPIIHVLRRMNNLVILVASGLIFGFSYCIAYTCSRTLANKYGYNALQIGLVLLAFGIGSLVGSVCGGRYSDHVFRKLKARNGGTSQAEMRLQSTMIFMPFLPVSVIAYGWVCERHVHVAAICVMLFLSGLFSIAIYSSTLAYIVDANNGRSSSAVATNSAFRGGAAFIAAEVAVPLQNAIGDGGMYSLWAGLLVFSELLILLVWWKGGAWRAKWEIKERGISGS